jgi:hypothetical protein
MKPRRYNHNNHPPALAGVAFALLILALLILATIRK